MPISRTRAAQWSQSDLNHQTSSLMAIAIIDGFKMIDVDHQTAQRSMGMDRQRHLRMQRFVKMMAVTQAGQESNSAFPAGRCANAIG